MTDAEIVARAIGFRRRELAGGPDVTDMDHLRALDVVAALTEAGRLVPEGCVAINAGRWERVRLVAAAGTRIDLNELWSAEDALLSGDLDAEPTP